MCAHSVAPPQVWEFNTSQWLSSNRKRNFGVCVFPVHTSRAAQHSVASYWCAGRCLTRVICVAWPVCGRLQPLIAQLRQRAVKRQLNAAE